MSSARAGAAERRVLHEQSHRLRIVGARAGVQRRLDKARADRIDAHALLAKLDGQRLGETEHAVLRGRIGRRTRLADMHERLDRADIDDASLVGAQRSQETHA